MLSSIHNEIAKDILKTIPEHSFEYDCDAVYETLRKHWQGLTPVQLAQVLNAKIALVFQTLIALESMNRVCRMPDARWVAIIPTNVDHIKPGENDQ